MTQSLKLIAASVGAVEVVRLRRDAGEHVVEHDRPALALSFRDLPGSEVRLRGVGDAALVATRRGTHCLMPPGTVVEGRWRTATDYLLMRFDPEGLDDALGAGALAEPLRYRRSAEDEGILALATLIAEEVESGGKRGRMYLEALTAALTIAVFPRAEPRPEASAAPRLRRALDRMHADLAADLSIDDLAAEACLSRFHFTRLFTREIGCSPYRYLVEQRLMAARALLTGTALPVAEVARRTGFKSVEHFTRLFTRETGVAPSGYRPQR